MGIEIGRKVDKGRIKHFPEGDGYYYYPIVDGKEYSSIGETEDVAMLIGLSIKYEGLNGQFTKYATRMLGIKSEWSK